MAHANPINTADIVGALTLEQRVGLTSGKDFWTTKEAPGVPSIMLTDGPHGVRKQLNGTDHLGISESVPATCFPPAVALGSTFDVELLTRVGAALGEEARAEGVGVLLGPGINIKRSLLCGRNFEYLSEDPLVAGLLGTALANGLQSQGVGASLKHFAVNNQETDRMRVSADVAERPLREIYLRAFQRVVEEANPWTVMCSYNRINGVLASQNPWLLNTLLRDEWGYEGLVVSDWAAVVDRVASISAGLDLEMPSSDGRTDREVVAAVRAGQLDESVVDTAAARVIDLVKKVSVAASTDATYDADAHHALAREAAAAGIVLLKNDGDILPITTDARIAVVGELGRTPRYQGAGSSSIVPTRLENALDEIRAHAGTELPFAPAYLLDGTSAPELIAQAVEVASSAETVVMFLGVPAAQESEGFDRDTIELPQVQLDALTAVVEANPRTVVVLSNGGVVRLSGFERLVPAILEGWLLGQAGGGAVADVLFGAVNPSGRLAETIPLNIEDSPAYLDFPGEHSHVNYGEGIFVGYRWYDARKLKVSYPFGHGLSYTSFSYSNADVVEDTDGLTVTVSVRNTGTREGAEIVQVYTSLPGSAVTRAPQQLAGFSKVLLAAGETRDVVVRVHRKDLAYWDTRVSRWVVEKGNYGVAVGSSSRDIRATTTIELAGDDPRVPLNAESTIGEVLAHPIAGPFLQAKLAATPGAASLTDESTIRMMMSAPIGRMMAMGGTDASELDQLFAAANR